MFNDRDYTREAAIKQLGLIQLHCQDGSGEDAGCQCIETKHLFNLEGLSEEGQGFALTEKERKFYAELGDISRAIRKNMEVENYDMATVFRDFKGIPRNRKSRPSALANASTRSALVFLPRGLTSCEKQHPKIQKKLLKCLLKNPIEVCRHKIRCPA